MRAALFVFGFWLVVCGLLAVCSLLAQEVQPYTNYQQAQRAVRMMLDSCWEDIGKSPLTYGNKEPEPEAYLSCVRSYIDRVLSGSMSLVEEDTDGPAR